MDAINSFSDKAGGLMEGVYQYDAKVLHVSPWIHERSKEKYKATRLSLLFFFHGFTKFCSCISIIN